MTRAFTRVRRDERGATLMLVVAFMVIAGSIGAAVISSVTSGVVGRAVLDQVRDRQYAADGAVEQAIARVRALAVPGHDACGENPPTLPYYRFPAINGTNGPLEGRFIRVDCTNLPNASVSTSDGVFPQFNVIFTACVDNGSACDDNDTNSDPYASKRPIVRAQVNFEGHNNGTGTSANLEVTKTWIQSWSVNR